MEYTIQTFTSGHGEVKVDEHEALRYLGYGKNIPDSQTSELIKVCSAELENIISAKCCYTRVPVILNAKTVNLGFGDIQSNALCKNLEGCIEAWLFAATIGIDVDRLILRQSKTSPTKSMICDALASSAIEFWCDEINNRLCVDIHCRPRFSPGYGDFDIKYQKDFIIHLDTNRKIGLTLTDSMLMTPTKSVTAAIGICDNKNIACGECQK